MPLSLYQKMVKVHADKDQLVTWKKLEEAQKSLRSHAGGQAKMFYLGGNKGNRKQSRCHENVSSCACEPPILGATTKTHKKVDKEGLSKSRPIVGAARGLTIPLGEIIKDLIKPITKARSLQW